MENYEHGLLFDPALSAEIKERFCYVNADRPSPIARNAYTPAPRSSSVSSCGASMM